MESVTISEFCSELLSEGLRLVTGRGHVLIPCSPHVSRHQHVFVVGEGFDIGHSCDLESLASNSIQHKPKPYYAKRDLTNQGPDAASLTFFGRD